MTSPPSASSWPVRMRKRVVFPRPVFPQDAHPLAGVHLEGEPVQNRLAHLVFFY